MMRPNKLVKFKKSLILWRRQNKQEWVASADMWNDLITTRIHTPCDTLHEFRYRLRSLVISEPGFIESRTKPSRAAEFRIIIKNGKYKTDSAAKVPVPTVAAQVEEKQESYKWRTKYNEVKNLLNQSHKNNILENLIIERVHKDILALPPVPFIPFASKELSGQQEEAMLIISDAHVGEFVSKDETDGLCEYDFEIHVRRFQYIADTIDRLNKHKIKVGLTKLTIAVLGDMCSGNIHEELEVSNEAHVVTQACMGGYVFSQFLRDMSTMFPEVEVICLSGNHGRIQKQKRFKQKNLDWDRVYYEIAAAYSRDLSNVSFTMPRSTYWVGDINGHTFLLFHGDHIRSWGGIPFYGVLRTVTNLKNQYAPHGRVIKYSVLGHFHTMGELADVHGDTILNGAFMGGNDFSLGAMAKVTYPGQQYFGVHPRIGRSWRYPLRLDTAPKTGDIRYKYDLDTSVADLVKKEL